MIPNHHVFYINLDRSIDRRAFIEAELEKAGLCGERVPAVNGYDVPPHFRSQFYTEGVLHSRLTAGEVGCYASHLLVHEAIIARNLPLAIVLEDDALFAPQIAGTIANVLAALPECWDLVHLAGRARRAYRPLRPIGNGSRLVRFSRTPAWSCAYIISNAGARKFYEQRRRWRPVDVDIQHHYEMGLDVYGILPAPVTQNRKSVDSLIKAQGGCSHYGPIERGMADPRQVLFNMRKLGFGWWLWCLLQNILLYHSIRRHWPRSPGKGTPQAVSGAVR